MNSILKSMSKLVIFISVILTLQYSSEARKPKYIIEDFTKCRDSLMWKWNLDLYDSYGAKTWLENLVPNFITTNSYIAIRYVKVVYFMS